MIINILLIFWTVLGIILFLFDNYYGTCLESLGGLIIYGPIMWVVISLHIIIFGICYLIEILKKTPGTIKFLYKKLKGKIKGEKNKNR